MAYPVNSVLKGELVFIESVLPMLGDYISIRFKVIRDGQVHFKDIKETLFKSYFKETEASRVLYGN